MKKFLSLILALTLMTSTVVSASQFSYSVDSPLVEGLTFIESTEYLDDGSNSHTYTFEYTPGRSALPVVAWGKSQKSRQTLSKIAEIYGKDVVGGINADFFSFYTGIPLGCLVSEGRFLSSAVNNNALAIMENGELYIGTPDIKSTITYGEAVYDFYYNKYPQIYSLYIMDSTYHTSTASTFPSLEIVLTPETDKLSVNTTVRCTVAEIFDEASDTLIPDGSFLLTVPTGHAAYEVMKNVQLGESLEISVTGSSPWSDASFVIGGGDIIVKDSAFVSETADEYSDKVRNARTAVGIRKDGTAVFFSVNGKKDNFSSGMTLKELAQTLINMGAVTALNFDGGGSSTVGVKHLGEDEFEIVNYSTDGYPRSISNALLFLNTSVPNYVPSNLILFPNFTFALPYADIPMHAAFLDSSMVELDSVEVVEAQYSSITEGVEFHGDYLTVMPADTNEREVTAMLSLNDGTTLEDSKVFYVPTAVDTITPTAEKQVLNIGESTNITVTAQYLGFEALSSLASFEWSFSDNNAEYLPKGVLAQNDVARLNSDGTLTVLTDTVFTTTILNAKYGDTVGSVKIFVGMPDMVIDNFEQSTIPHSKGYKSENALLVENDGFTYENALEVAMTPKAIGLMHEGKYNTPASLVILNSEGEEIVIEYKIKKDYSEITGWTELEAVLPEDIEGKVFIKSPFVLSNGERAVVDDLSAKYGYGTNIFDDIDSSWAKDYITAIYDMGLIAGYKADGKTLFAPDRQITRAEFAKLVSSFQRYEFDGNELEFVDNSEIPQWAVSYIGAVSQNSIMNGRAEAQGLVFAPNAPITRNEAMLVLSRIMPDGDELNDLTFTDSSEVPDWSQDGVKKVVSGGIITGYDDNTLRPSAYITRAETAVVFSRLFEYMYSTSEQTNSVQD